MNEGGFLNETGRREGSAGAPLLKLVDSQSLLAASHCCSAIENEEERSGDSADNRLGSENDEQSGNDISPAEEGAGRDF
jgi:hypothetical protein